MGDKHPRNIAPDGKNSQASSITKKPAVNSKGNSIANPESQTVDSKRKPPEDHGIQIADIKSKPSGNVLQLATCKISQNFHTQETLSGTQLIYGQAKPPSGRQPINGPTSATQASGERAKTANATQPIDDQAKSNGPIRQPAVETTEPLSTTNPTKDQAEAASVTQTILYQAILDTQKNNAKTGSATQKSNNEAKAGSGTQKTNNQTKRGNGPEKIDSQEKADKNVSSDRASPKNEPKKSVEVMSVPIHFTQMCIFDDEFIDMRENIKANMQKMDEEIEKFSSRLKFIYESEGLKSTCGRSKSGRGTTNSSKPGSGNGSGAYLGSKISVSHIAIHRNDSKRSSAKTESELERIKPSSTEQYASGQVRIESEQNSITKANNKQKDFTKADNTLKINSMITTDQRYNSKTGDKFDKLKSGYDKDIAEPGSEEGTDLNPAVEKFSILKKSKEEESIRRKTVSISFSTVSCPLLHSVDEKAGPKLCVCSSASTAFLQTTELCVCPDNKETEPRPCVCSSASKAFSQTKEPCMCADKKERVAQPCDCSSASKVSLRAKEPCMCHDKKESEPQPCVRSSFSKTSSRTKEACMCRNKKERAPLPCDCSSGSQAFSEIKEPCVCPENVKVESQPCVCSKADIEKIGIMKSVSERNIAALNRSPSEQRSRSRSEDKSKSKFSVNDGKGTEKISHTIAKHEPKSSLRSARQGNSSSIPSSEFGNTPIRRNTISISYSTIFQSCPLIHTVDGENKILKLQFDVSHFYPEEVSVIIADKRRLIIAARHEEITDGRKFLHNYKRELYIPVVEEPNSIKSYLLREGILIVETPVPNKKEPEPSIQEEEDMSFISMHEEQKEPCICPGGEFEEAVPCICSSDEISGMAHKLFKKPCMCPDSEECVCPSASKVTSRPIKPCVCPENIEGEPQPCICPSVSNALSITKDPCVCPHNIEGEPQPCVCSSASKVLSRTKEPCVCPEKIIGEPQPCVCSSTSKEPCVCPENIKGEPQPCVCSSASKAFSRTKELCACPENVKGKPQSCVCSSASQAFSRAKEPFVCPENIKGQPQPCVCPSNEFSGSERSRSCLCIASESLGIKLNDVISSKRTIAEQLIEDIGGSTAKNEIESSKQVHHNKNALDSKTSSKLEDIGSPLSKDQGQLLIPSKESDQQKEISGTKSSSVRLKEIKLPSSSDKKISGSKALSVEQNGGTWSKKISVPVPKINRLASKGQRKEDNSKITESNRASEKTKNLTGSNQDATHNGSMETTKKDQEFDFTKIAINKEKRSGSQQQIIGSRMSKQTIQLDQKVSNSGQLGPATCKRENSEDPINLSVVKKSDIKIQGSTNVLSKSYKTVDKKHSEH